MAGAENTARTQDCIAVAIVHKCPACESERVRVYPERRIDNFILQEFECTECGHFWKKKITKYSYKDVPTIARFAASNKRHRLIIGPFGSGKSVGCVMEIIRRAHMQKPSALDGIRRTRWAIVRNTFAQLRDTTMKTFFDWFPPAGHCKPGEEYGIFKITDHDYTITKFKDVEIEIMFRALDRPDQVSNLLSLELTGAWINEAREIDRAIWMGLDGRLGRFPRKGGRATWRGMILDTNPPDQDNWLYKIAEEEKPDNFEVFKQPGGLSKDAENLSNLDADYYTELVKGKTPEYIKVYINAQYGFVNQGRPIYKDTYNDVIHCASSILEPNKKLNLITGWDFALMPSLVIGQLEPNGKLRILDELLGIGMGAERFLETMVMPLLNTKYRGFGVFGFGDPTGNSRVQTNESTCYKVLQDNHFYWVKQAPTNAEIPRISAVESFLTRLCDGGEPAFQLSPNCMMLRKGFNGGYRYKDNGEVDDSLYTHPHDALQYLCLYCAGRMRELKRPVLKRSKMGGYKGPATEAGY